MQLRISRFKNKKAFQSKANGLVRGGGRVVGGAGSCMVRAK